MAIEYLDPSAEPGVPVEPYLCRLPADQTAPAIGLLANGYPDSVPFLGHLESALKALLPGAAEKIARDCDPGVAVPRDAPTMYEFASGARAASQSPRGSSACGTPSITIGRTAQGSAARSRVSAAAAESTNTASR